MTQVDRIDGLIGSIAVKVPCKAATTANITLSGEQTIDGVALVAGDRCLVKDQTTASENGIYDVSATAWSRSRDFDGARDIAQGTCVRIISGTVSGQYFYEVTTANPSVGATAITFGLVNFPATTSAYMATLLNDATAAEARATLEITTSSINGSFESVNNDDGLPVNWTITEYPTTGVVALDSTDQAHGAKALKFTSIGDGGGTAESDVYIEVAEDEYLHLSYRYKSSVANVRNLVQLSWYTSSKSLISTNTLLDDSTTNPTTFTLKTHTGLQAPATARFAKVKLTGCESSDATPGSTWFDAVRAERSSTLNTVITDLKTGSLLRYNGTSWVNFSEAGKESLWPGTTPPPYAFEEDGSLVSMTTYEELYDVIGTEHGRDAGTVTTFDNTTETATSAGHGLLDGDVIEVSNSGGALPSGLIVATKYFIINKTTNTFQLSLTLDGEVKGFTTDGTGTNYFHAQYKLPDARGRAIRIWDNGAGNDPGAIIAETGNTVNTSPIITNLTSTALMEVDMLVTGTGIPSGAKILTINSATQVTLDANATATNTGVSLDFTNRTDRGDGTIGDAIGTKQTDGFKQHTHLAQMQAAATSGAGAGANVYVGSAATGTAGGNETRMINTSRMLIIQYA